MLAKLIVLAAILFSLNFVMDRYLVRNIYEQTKTSILSMIFWLGGTMCTAIALLVAVKHLTGH